MVSNKDSTIGVRWSKTFSTSTGRSHKKQFTKKQLHRFANPTDLQRLARRRNSNKWRLLGFQLDPRGLTEEELKIYQDFAKQLLNHWDHNSIKLGLKPKMNKYDTDRDSLL